MYIYIYLRRTVREYTYILRIRMYVHVRMHYAYAYMERMYVCMLCMRVIRRIVIEALHCRARADAE